MPCCWRAYLPHMLAPGDRAASFWPGGRRATTPGRVRWRHPREEIAEFDGCAGLNGYRLGWLTRDEAASGPGLVRGFVEHEAEAGVGGLGGLPGSGRRAGRHEGLDDRRAQSPAFRFRRSPRLARRVGGLGRPAVL